MIEFVVYQAAQRLTADAVRQALPAAPMRSAPVVAGRDARGAMVRQRTSVILRGLADRIDPAPVRREPAVVGC